MIEFNFDKKPKFPEVETGHVYFDTSKDASGGSLTYRYEDGTNETTIDGITFRRVCDFKTKEELIGATMLVSSALRMATIDASMVEVEDAGDGVIVLGVHPFGDLLAVGASSAIVDGGIPTAGCYLASGVDYIAFPSEAPAASDPLSKNVTVKAHTEYTSHVNGKIDEGDRNSFVDYTMELDQDADEVKLLPPFDFEKAKELYLSGATIFFHGADHNVYYLINTYDPDCEILASYGDGVNLHIRPNGTVGTVF